jgi:5-methyltetrahydropteroyltriglutamate--homocysteine methyltransferase
MLFGCLPHQRFLIECDADRVSFDVLRFVPPEKVVVLGLVSTTRHEPEEEDVVLRRIDEAIQHLSVDQLAISTQCGFAPEADGRHCSEAMQWRTLELVLRVAERVWGSSGSDAMVR